MEPHIGDFRLGERIVYRRFTCASCGTPCLTDTTDADANREYLASGWSSSGGLAAVCDDCYENIMTRARKDGLI